MVGGHRELTARLLGTIWRPRGLKAKGIGTRVYMEEAFTPLYN
jgi:hypothetical protein